MAAASMAPAAGSSVTSQDPPALLPDLRPVPPDVLPRDLDVSGGRQRRRLGSAWVRCASAATRPRRARLPCVSVGAFGSGSGGRASAAAASGVIGVVHECCPLWPWRRVACSGGVASTVGVRLGGRSVGCGDMLVVSWWCGRRWPPWMCTSGATVVLLAMAKVGAPETPWRRIWLPGMRISYAGENPTSLRMTSLVCFTSCPS
jgi:hypothetical protein